MTAAATPLVLSEVFEFGPKQGPLAVCLHGLGPHTVFKLSVCNVFMEKLCIAMLHFGQRKFLTSSFKSKKSLVTGLNRLVCFCLRHVHFETEFKAYNGQQNLQQSKNPEQDTLRHGQEHAA